MIKAFWKKSNFWEVLIVETYTPYLDNGYLFSQVTPIETEIRNDTIDIEVRIYEGAQARINRVSVSGNTKTNDHVIMREIRTKPGDLFSRSDIMRSQKEIATLNYFDAEKLNLDVEPNQQEGTLDLNYIVEEKIFGPKLNYKAGIWCR